MAATQAESQLKETNREHSHEISSEISNNTLQNGTEKNGARSANVVTDPFSKAKYPPQNFNADMSHFRPETYINQPVQHEQNVEMNAKHTSEKGGYLPSIDNGKTEVNYVKGLPEPAAVGSNVQSYNLPYSPRSNFTHPEHSPNPMQMNSTDNSTGTDCNSSNNSNAHQNSIGNQFGNMRHPFPNSKPMPGAVRPVGPHLNAQGGNFNPQHTSQRFMAGQNLPQQIGPTPTLNQLLQSSNPVHRYQNSNYEYSNQKPNETPHATPFNHGWNARPMAPYGNQPGVGYRNPMPNASVRCSTAGVSPGSGGPPYPQQPPPGSSVPGPPASSYPPHPQPPSSPSHQQQPITSQQYQQYPQRYPATPNVTAGPPQQSSPVRVPAYPAPHHQNPSVRCNTVGVSPGSGGPLYSQQPPPGSSVPGPPASSYPPHPQPSSSPSHQQQPITSQQYQQYPQRYPSTPIGAPGPPQQSSPVRMPTYPAPHHPNPSVRCNTVGVSPGSGGPPYSQQPPPGSSVPGPPASSYPPHPQPSSSPSHQQQPLTSQQYQQYPQRYPATPGPPQQSSPVRVPAYPAPHHQHKVGGFNNTNSNMPPSPGPPPGMYGGRSSPGMAPPHHHVMGPPIPGGHHHMGAGSNHPIPNLMPPHGNSHHESPMPPPSSTPNSHSLPAQSVQSDSPMEGGMHESGGSGNMTNVSQMHSNTVTSVITTGPDGAPIDEASQQSTLSNTSAASGEDPSSTPKRKESGLGMMGPMGGYLGHGHALSPLPPCSPNTNSIHDDYSSESSQGWSRAPSSPVFNSHMPQDMYRSKKSDSLGKLYEMDDSPDRRIWVDKLLRFMEERGTPILQCPTISKNPLDLFRLYIYVKERGGFMEVCKVAKNKIWKDIAGLLGIGVSSSGACTLRRHYTKSLLPFECHFDRGGIDPQPIIDQLESGSKKKGAKTAPVPSPGSSNSQDSLPSGHSGSGPSMDGYAYGYGYGSASGASAASEYGMPSQPGGYQGQPGYNQYSNDQYSQQYMGSNSYTPSRPMYPGYPHVIPSPPRPDSQSSPSPYPPSPQQQQQQPFPQQPPPSSAAQQQPSISSSSQSIQPSISPHLPPQPSPQGPSPHQSSLPSSQQMSQQQPPVSPVPTSQPQSVSQQISPQSMQPSIPPHLPPQPPQQGPSHQASLPSNQQIPQQQQPSVSPVPTPQQQSATQQMPPMSSHDFYRQQQPPVSPAPSSQQQTVAQQMPSVSSHDFYRQQQPPVSPAPTLQQQSANQQMPPVNSHDFYRQQQPPVMTAPTLQQQSATQQMPPASSHDFYRQQQPPVVSPAPTLQQQSATQQMPPVSSHDFYRSDQQQFPNQNTMGTSVNNSYPPSGPSKGMPAPIQQQRRHPDFSSKESQPSPPPNAYAPYPNQSRPFPPGMVDQQKPYASNTFWKGWPNDNSNRNQYPRSQANVAVSPVPPWLQTQMQRPPVARKRLTKNDVAPVDAWKLMMSLRSGLLTETCYVLDVLNILLFDDTSVQYFGLAHLPGLLDILLEHFIRSLDDMLESSYESSGRKWYERPHHETTEPDLGRIVEPINIKDCLPIRTNLPDYTFKSRRGKTVATVDGSEDLFVRDGPRDWESRDMQIEDVVEPDPRYIVPCFRSEFGIVPFVRLMPEAKNYVKKRRAGTNIDNDINHRTKKEPAVIVKTEPDLELSTSSTSTDYVQTNANEKKRKVSMYEDECYTRDEASLYLVTDTQDAIARRCICISTILRNLTFIPGNEFEFSKNSSYLALMGKLLLIHHEHPLRTQKQQNYDREDDTDFSDCCSSLQGDSEWWWDFLHQIRENVLVSIANISGYIDLSNYLEDVSRPILDGLLHWAVCPAAQGQDPFPTAPSLSPQKLALEALCKLCVTDANVDLVIATPPYSRLEKLCSVLTKLLCRSEEQVLREFAINLLHYLAAADTSMSRIIALQSPCISLLVAFIEQAEQSALGVANQHGINALRDNPESMGTSLDMLRRAARTLLHLSKHPDNKPLFLQREQRLLALVMSQILDQQVAGIISQVLYQCSRAISPAPVKS